jgi:hypothetical protein
VRERERTEIILRSLDSVLSAESGRQAAERYAEARLDAIQAVTDVESRKS